MFYGYMHPDYAESLKEFGEPTEMHHCGGWILKRSIPGFPYHDAMGCYPLFACRDWTRLKIDLDILRPKLVTVSLVTDPFGDFSLDYLKNCFDVVRPFKKHFITDLRRPLQQFISKHHRQRALKSFEKGIKIEIVPEPINSIGDWVSLYDVLIKRHKIKGIRAFSLASFAKQFSIPGLKMFKALHEDKTVGATLLFIQNNIVYFHLSACSNTGYKLGASFALKWNVIEYFFKKHRWFVLGGGAGVENERTDGLSKFKEGWSTGTRTVYFCGRILDHKKYMEIINGQTVSTKYFPAYRQGEFM